MITASDLVRISVRQVIRQRTLGVIFSIALGITAFITLSVLGREIRYTISQDMVLMGGVNVMQVYLDDAKHPGQPLREFYAPTVEAVRNIPGVANVSLNIWGGILVPIRKGEATHNTEFIPVDADYWDVYAGHLVAGRLIDADDVKEHRRVCVLGRDAATDLYGSPEAALEQLIYFGNDVFRVVGVAGGVMLGHWTRGGFMPYTVMQDRNWGGGKPNRIFVRAVSWEGVEALKQRIPDVIREQQDAPHITIRTADEQLKRIQTTFVFIEALLWLGIAASLMLGGFGIWYGTFSAVRARTREVGLKKAMGGSDTDIMMQFLTEALCKAVAGGVLGILIGTCTVELGSFMLGCPVSYAQLFVSSMGSIVFSAFIGIAGGIYPALQASRMDVVSALRFE